MQVHRKSQHTKLQGVIGKILKVSTRPHTTRYRQLRSADVQWRI